MKPSGCGKNIPADCYIANTSMRVVDLAEMVVKQKKRRKSSCEMTSSFEEGSNLNCDPHNVSS